MKNKLDSLFFARLIVPRTSQISLYPTRETAFAAFSCGSSNVNVLGMEINMINWYRHLYMDEVVKKNPGKCRKRVEKRRPWKKNYYAVTLAANPANLFDIMGTRQMFFRRFAYLDIYVVGLAATKEEAVTLLQQIIERMDRENCWNPGKIFKKKDFTRKRKSKRFR